MCKIICNHDNTEYVDPYEVNADEDSDETAYACLDCGKRFIRDRDGIIIWESEE